MKTIIKTVCVCLATCALCMTLCACDSENVKNAKEAYNEGNYAEAIELLNAEEQLNASAKELLANSKAQLANEQGDYSVAISELIAVNKPSSDALYKEILQNAIEDANATGNSEHLIGIIQQDSSNTASIYEALETEAIADNIKAYQAMDGISSNSDLEEAVKEQFTSFIRENGEQRARAFLIGTWEYVEDGEDIKTRVDIKPQKDDLIGIVSQVSNHMIQYQFQTGDVYWTDFVFLEPTQFTCKNLTKSTNGSPDWSNAVGTINYNADDTFTLHLTPDSGFYIINEPNRIWKRVAE